MSPLFLLLLRYLISLLIHYSKWNSFSTWSFCRSMRCVTQFSQQNTSLSSRFVHLLQKHIYWYIFYLLRARLYTCDLLSHLLLLYYLVPLSSLISLLHFCLIVVSIDLLFSHHRHLQPVSSHSAEGKPRWGRRPCRGATPWLAQYSHPKEPWSSKDSTAPSSQATIK